MSPVIQSWQAHDYPPRRDGKMRKRQALSTERAKDLNPLLSLVEDWMTAPGGYVEHIHRGYESLTLVLEGELSCAEYQEGPVLLHPGDVQWASAGIGLSHSEVPHGDAQAHTLQLWTNLPMAAKGARGSIQTARAAEVPRVEGGGWSARVLCGSFEGREGPLRPALPLRILELRLLEGGQLALDLPADHRALLYVVDGELFAAEEFLQPGGVLQADSAEEASLPLAASRTSHLLFVLAPVLREPVEASGPFVVNTKAEVKRAYDDFRAGFFNRLKVP